jgi:tetratricopeptide (TPR) repeat protein
LNANQMRISKKPPKTSAPRSVAMDSNQGVVVTGDYPLIVTKRTERRSPGQKSVVFGDIPKRPPAFQPRDALHDDLINAGNIAVITTLAGARGIGKTHLAAAYARECIDAGWSLVAWIGAERSDQILVGLDQLSEVLGLKEEGDSPELAADRVRRWLERARNKKRLVVFDNASDPDSLSRWLPSAGSTRVVITSNQRSFDSVGTLIDVEAFTPAEARAYLLERTDLQDEAGAIALSEELGYLPLALAQASAVIRAQRLSYPDFLERLHKVNLDQCLIRQPGDSYPRGAAETVILALQQAEHRDGLAEALLLLISVLSAAGVSRKLLYDAGINGALTFWPWGRKRSFSRAEIDATLEKLVTASLVTFSMGGDAVIMHRLTQRVSRERARKSSILPFVLFAATRFISGRSNATDLDWKRREDIEQLIQQISAVWDNANVQFARDSFRFFSPFGSLNARSKRRLEQGLLMLRIWSADKLRTTYNLSRAIKLGISVTSDCERILGPEHPKTLESRSNLANAYFDAGQLDEAIELTRQVLADRERVLGPEHPQTLAGRTNLAAAYRTAGRVSEAIDLDRQTIVEHERVFGLDNPQTLMSRGGLANAYYSAGQLDEAIKLHRQLLADRERVLGPDDPQTLGSRSNLALVLHRGRQFDEAINLYHQTIEDRERVLGRDHPDTLISRNNLAMVYQDADRLDEAIDLHRQVLADRERVLGPEHPHTLASHNNLATAYVAAERFSEGINLHRQNIEDQKRILSPDHPETLASRHNLAYACRAAGQLDDAIRLYREVLADKERVLGSDHIQTRLGRISLVETIKERAARRRKPPKRRSRRRR